MILVSSLFSPCSCYSSCSIIQQRGRWTAHPPWEKGHGSSYKSPSAFCIPSSIKLPKHRPVSSHLPRPPPVHGQYKCSIKTEVFTAADFREIFITRDSYLQKSGRKKKEGNEKLSFGFPFQRIADVSVWEVSAISCHKILSSPAITCLFNIIIHNFFTENKCVFSLCCLMTQ